MLTGLLYAMRGEIKSLLTPEAQPERVAAGVAFYRIRENVVACCGGVGKVNAAMATQLFIDLYRPDRLINVGVAGCFEDVPIGTLVLAEKFMQHDVDTTAVGDPIGMVSTVEKVEFPTAELEKAKAAMDRTGRPYRVGGVATGEWFATKGDRARWIVPPAAGGDGGRRGGPGVPAKRCTVHGAEVRLGLRAGRSQHLL